MHDRLSIGPRIAIRGPTGSGKSTLGHTLAQRFGLPVVDMDTLYWPPNWQAKPLNQFRTDVQAALEACPQGWICVDNYSHVQDLVLFQADTVLWLRLPYVHVRADRKKKATFDRQGDNPARVSATQ